MEKRVLIARWIGPDTTRLPIYDEASVSAARQRVRQIGQELNASQELTESAALIASELTHNQLFHARQGYFAVRPVERDGVKGIEVVAADIGPGIPNPTFTGKEPASTASTSGSLGEGLASVARIADEVEVDNRISEGICIVARKFETRITTRRCDIAIMGRPYPGEAISGDDGVMLESDSGFIAAVSDGLGHGPEARQASNRAIEALTRMQEQDLAGIATGLNNELVGTRGCAMSIVRFTRENRTIECVSLGDVHSHLYSLRDAHFFASTPFILGERRPASPKIRVETAEVPSGSVLVVFSDGLKSRTSLKGQLDVLRQPPIAIARHLLEHDSRPDDDALVLVARIR